MRFRHFRKLPALVAGIGCALAIGVVSAPAHEGTHTLTVAIKGAVAVEGFSLTVDSRDRMIECVRSSTGVRSGTCVADVPTVCGKGECRHQEVRLSARSIVVWGGSCGGTSDTCDIVMDEHRWVSASVLSRPGPSAGNGRITVDLAGRGRVTSSDTRIDCGPDCEADYREGAFVHLTATPDAGYRFSHWGSNGCPVIQDASCTVTISGTKGAVANFERTRHPLIVNRHGSGSGSVTSDPAGIECPETCAEYFVEGTTVTLTATPEPGSIFKGWSHCADPTVLSCAVTVDAPQTVFARFEPTRTLTVGKSGSGLVTGDGINCGEDCAETVQEGNGIQLQAQPADGWVFDGWDGDGDACDDSIQFCTVALDEDRHVVARFVLPVSAEVRQEPKSLFVTFNRPATGRITCADGNVAVNGLAPTSGAIPCAEITGFIRADGTDGSDTLDTSALEPGMFGPEVAVYMHGGAGHDTLSGGKLGDHLFGGAGDDVVIGRDGDDSLTGGAALDNDWFEGGAGTDTVWLAGTEGNDTIAPVLPDGSFVTPAAETTYSGVENLILEGRGGDDTLTGRGGDDWIMGGDGFDTIAGGAGKDSLQDAAGGASMTGGPGDDLFQVDGGIVTLDGQEGADTYYQWMPADSEVTIRDTGRAGTDGIRFPTHLPELCNSPTVFSESAIVRETARVDYSGVETLPCDRKFERTVFVTKSGEGTVTSSPAGISCGGDCNGDFAYGTVVTLTATPAAGWSFAGWSGACSGAEATCDVSVNDAKLATATFIAVQQPPAPQPPAPQPPAPQPPASQPPAPQPPAPQPPAPAKPKAAPKKFAVCHNGRTKKLTKKQIAALRKQIAKANKKKKAKKQTFKMGACKKPKKKR